MNSDDKLLEEFKLLVSTGKEYFGFYFRSYILYIAILGVLLKLFFDAELNSVERVSVYWIGIGVNISGVIGTIGAYPKYKMIADRCDEVSEAINIPNVYFDGTLRVAKAFLTGIFIIGVAWLFLFYII